jgi:hypothetical protein
MTMWTGFVRIRVWISGGLVNTFRWLRIPKVDEEYLEQLSDC